MRVLFVTPFFPPQDAVASLRTHAFARAWADAPDVDLTVLTTTKRSDQGTLRRPLPNALVVEIDPQLPEWLVWLRQAGKSDRGAAGGGSTRAGLRSLHRRLGVFGGLRMPDLTDAWVRPALGWAAIQPVWDVVISSSGPYTAHLVALALRRHGRARRWIADFRDLWCENHVGSGVFPFTLRERALERQCRATADHLWTVSDGLAERLRRGSRGPVTVIPNGFDEAEFIGLDPERAFPQDGCVRIVYTGTLYPHGQDPEPLWAAIARLRTDDPEAFARLRIAVAGPDEAAWRRGAEAHGVTACLEWHGPRSREEALRMQRDADGLLAIEWSAGHPGVLSGKIFEYLRAGPRVIVLGDDDDAPIARLVRETGRGERWHPTTADVPLAAFLADPSPPVSNPEALAPYRRTTLAEGALDIIREMAAGYAGVPAGATT